MTSKKRSGRSPGNPAGKHPKPEDEGAGVVWIKTEPALDGSGYVVTLEASDDVAVTLTPDRAIKYAQGILAAAHRAAYDASVCRQMSRKFAFAPEDVARLLKLLRDDRPPLDPEHTAPIHLEPGVNLDWKPFLVLSINGKEVGQWDVDQAVDHAMAVLAMIAVADLDSGYFRMLVGQVQIDEPTARAAVDDLVNFREELL